MPGHPWEVLDTFQSSSNPNIEYEVRKGGDGTVYCTCPRWRFGQGKSSCKHVDQVMQDLKPRIEVGTKNIISCSQLQAGDVIEVNSNGNIFLMKVRCIIPNFVRGTELLDANTPRSSLRGEREVKIDDVIRIVVPAHR